MRRVLTGRPEQLAPPITRIGFAFVLLALRSESGREILLRLINPISSHVRLQRQFSVSRRLDRPRGRHHGRVDGDRTRSGGECGARGLVSARFAAAIFQVGLDGVVVAGENEMQCVGVPLEEQPQAQAGTALVEAGPQLLDAPAAVQVGLAERGGGGVNGGDRRTANQPRSIHGGSRGIILKGEAFPFSSRASRREVP